MATPLPQDKGARGLLIAASLVVVIAGIKAAASLILPFLISIFIAMITLPLLNWLQSKKIPTPLAVLATILVAVGVLTGVAIVIGDSIKDFTVEAPKYKARLDVMFRGVIENLQARGINLSDALTTDLVEPGRAMDLVTGTLRGVAAVLSNLLFVFLTIVFILFEAAGFPAKLRAAFGQRQSSDRFAKIRNEVQRYLATKTVISLTTGILVGSAMAIIGVDFALLWGTLAFMLNYIPNLGSIIAAVPPGPSRLGPVGTRSCHGGRAGLRGRQRDARQPAGTLFHGAAARAVDAGRLPLPGLLGLGLGAGGYVVVRPVDDDRQDHAGEHRGSTLDRGSAGSGLRRRPRGARGPARPGMTARSMGLKRILVHRSALLLVAVGCGGPLPLAPPQAGATPGRVVVLAPAAAEMLAALDLDSRVVGIGEFGPWPGDLGSLPVVGGYSSPNVERILALHTELLITTASEAGAASHQRLEQLGVQVLALDTGTYAGVFESLTEVGGVFDRSESAREIATRMRERLTRVSARAEGLTRRRVVFVVGRDPLYVAGPGSHVDEMIAMAGGENVAHDALAPYQQVSLETILERMPEVIIDTSDNTVQAEHGRHAGHWGRWPFLPAVQNDRVYWIEPGRLVIPGIRLPEMTELMGRLVHPEIYGDFDAAEANGGTISRKDSVR